MIERPKRGRPRKDAATTSVVAPAPAATTTPTVTTAPVAPVPAPATEDALPVIMQMPTLLARAAEAEIAEAEIAKAASATPPAPLAQTAPPTEGVVDLLKPDEVFQCGCETLFVDTIPQKGWPGEPPVWLDSLMAAFTRLAAVSAKQADIAMIRYEAKGYLRTAIRILMKFLPKTVVVTTSTAGAAEFLEVITPYAKLVFRGIR